MDIVQMSPIMVYNSKNMPIKAYVEVHTNVKGFEKEEFLINSFDNQKVEVITTPEKKTFFVRFEQEIKKQARELLVRAGIIE